MNYVVILKNSTDFNNMLSKSRDNLVLLIVSSSTCPACRTFEANLTNSFMDWCNEKNISVYELIADQDMPNDPIEMEKWSRLVMDLLQKHSIRRVPSLILIKNEQTIEVVRGCLTPFPTDLQLRDFLIKRT